ncbi:nuclease-related domain-containing protein [Jeotgalibacillus salarius]|uniref:NERD domain-containing protein n=1 Tax=Jeotgalibacillus salarius TaxID=546023 RepID=A0A4Y8LMV2_9BACL|nr:nuclease-related domain-containing protein [Jeotgalibacillus salarius]TFE03923.1 NERD domain-containing protein [Jeotgalibacillus salarius]
MYSNTRLPSVKHQTFQALARRTHPQHHAYPQILQKLSIEDAGYHGEQYFDQVAAKLLSPHCSQLKNLLLSQFKETFQIDSIIITPNFILICEIKNMVGNLHFDQRGGTLTRVLNNQKEYFTCPIFQVSRHSECISHLLKQMKIKVPVYDLVIYTNQRVEFSVKDSETEIYEKIHRIEQFTYYFRKMLHANAQHYLSSPQIKFIYQFLLKKDVFPFWRSYLNDIDIRHTDFIKGFICIECNRPAQSIRGGWRCDCCMKRRDGMLYQNIIDFFLLHGPSATAEEIRAFLNMSNKRQVIHYLKKLGFEPVQAGNHYVFHSPIHESTLKNK